MTAEQFHMALEWCACALAAGALLMLRKRARRQASSPPAIPNQPDHWQPILQQLNWGIAAIPEGWDRIDVMNEAFCGMFGFTANELTAQSPAIFLPAVAHPTLVERSRKEENFSMELTLQRKNGETFPALLNVSTVKTVRGAPAYYLVNIQDITSLKAQETAILEHAKTQAALLREVNHRVKNNFGSIVGLLQLKREYARTPQEATHLKDMETNLSGLAAVHDVLSSNGWRPICMDELCQLLIRTTMTMAGSLCSVNVISQTRDITVSNSQVHHLAMIFNELASNSLKHARTPGQPQAITVTLSRNENITHVRFQDNGPGYPPSLLDPPRDTRGTGLQIIHDLVTLTLNGTFVLLNDRGATACISFPPHSLGKVDRP